MPSIDKQKKQLSQALDSFYQNPIAKVSIELFLTVGLVLFLALFAIKPTLLTMAELVREIEEKKNLDELLTKKVAALSTAQTLYLTLENKLYLLDQAIPSTPNVIESLKIIEKIATDSNVVLNSASVNEIPEKEQAPTIAEQLAKNDITFVVNLIGDYSSIKNFVSKVQNSRQTFVIESVVFNASDDRGTKRLRASVTMSTPYFGTAQRTPNAQK